MPQYKMKKGGRKEEGGKKGREGEREEERERKRGRENSLLPQQTGYLCTKYESRNQDFEGSSPKT